MSHYYYAIVDGKVHEFKGEGLPNSTWSREVGLQENLRWKYEFADETLIRFTFGGGGHIRHAGPYSGVMPFKSIATGLRSAIRMQFERTSKGHKDGVKSGLWYAVPADACGGFWVDSSGRLRPKMPYPEGYEE